MALLGSMVKPAEPVIVLVPTILPEASFQATVKVPLPLPVVQSAVPVTFDHVTVPLTMAGWLAAEQPVSVGFCGPVAEVASIDCEVPVIPGLKVVEPAMLVHAI